MGEIKDDGRSNIKLEETWREVLGGEFTQQYMIKLRAYLVERARAGNVIGGGDWATDRIVPDCMRAWSKNESVDIRSPHSTRPWQHVLEPLSGYLPLAAKL